MRRLCAISVDLDSMDCYYQIHGLGPVPPGLRSLVMRRCLPRFADLFAERGISATFFVVGADVDVGRNGDHAREARRLLAELAAKGHELANHSYSHPYQFARLGRQALCAELDRATELIAEVSGQGVHGFRAPGYAVSPLLIEELCARGYAYDSSILPAPVYYAAKASVMAGMRLAGRKSGAVLLDPRTVVAPRMPYRPDMRAPWRRGTAPLWELPIAVTRFARLPVIGTALLVLPDRLRSAWLRGVCNQPMFNFELHGIDLADADADGLPGDLVARQPDLRRTLDQKLSALSWVLEVLAPAFDFVTLSDLAAEAGTLA